MELVGLLPCPRDPECLYLHDFIGPDAGVELQALHLGDVGAQAAVLSCGGSRRVSILWQGQGDWCQVVPAPCPPPG